MHLLAVYPPQRGIPGKFFCGETNLEGTVLEDVSLLYSGLTAKLNSLTV